MNPFNLEFQISKRLCHGFILCLAAAFIWGATPALAAAEMTTVRVRDKAEIDDREVFLGQIAVIEGGDIQLIQKLKSIFIGKAPLPGKSRSFDQQHLKMRLRYHQIDLSAVYLELPQQVEILRSYVEIDKQKMEKIISDFIIQNSPQEDKIVRIKEIRLPQNVVLSKGRITYKVRAPRSRELMGRCSIAVEFSVNGHSQKTVWATAMVEVLGPVVVTRRPLGRYKPITEDDIVLETMDLAVMPSNVISDPAAVLGKRTKRAIGAQIPLRTDVIELPPLVKRGDLVVIIAESKGLKITARGQVKKKGRRGERIPVVNVDSKKVLYARVLDANTVKVDF
jgi:flagella basal body P-ring formation protein FlgA